MNLPSFETIECKRQAFIYSQISNMSEVASLTTADCVGKETSSFVSVYWLEVGDGAATPYNDLTSYAEMKSQYWLNLEVDKFF